MRTDQGLLVAIVKWLERRALKLSGGLGSSSSANSAVLDNGKPASAVDAQRDAMQRAEQGEFAAAAELYRFALDRDPRDVASLFGLGLALCHLGQFREAVEHLESATREAPSFSQAHNCLGFALRGLGRFTYSESAIQRALQIDPRNAAYRKNLAQTLLRLSKVDRARECYELLLKDTVGDVESILGLAEVARLEGRFEEAEQLLKKAIDIQPTLAGAWASLAYLRRMGRDDAQWLQRAEQLLASNLPRLDELSLRFAIGKYWDDLEDYHRAFESFRAANERLRATSRPYNREARTRFVDAMVQIYTPQSILHARSAGSNSDRPVFVVGMPRSGTSLVEQIIASHPSAHGAGELGFWSEVLLANVAEIQRGILPADTRRRLADAYLQLLSEQSGDAKRVVDKAPVNSEYLGFIYSVFPQAKFIYVRRDPIDTCLSCYFQYLSPALSYTMDLADLAHYYRQHHRQIAHWRAVLPPGTILNVQYEDLVADQESETRRILKFVGVEWDERCLRFHETARAVTTASGWQVRQKMYSSSVRRWRKYQPYIAPLLGLQELAELTPLPQQQASWQIGITQAQMR